MEMDDDEQGGARPWAEAYAAKVGYDNLVCELRAPVDAELELEPPGPAATPQETEQSVEQAALPPPNWRPDDHGLDFFE
jgi:hypothetical protein